MFQQSANPHLECYLKVLPVEFGQTIWRASHHSILFRSRDKIAKIRKPTCRIFGCESSTRLRSLTMFEYDRGKQIEPEIYYQVIQIKCGLHRGFCNAALIMKRLGNEQRLDRLPVNSIRKSIFADAINDRLCRLYRCSLPVVPNFDYALSLQAGNERFFRLFKSDKIECECQLKKLWWEMIRATSKLAGPLNDQVARGCVKSLHGDLNWTNIYKDGNNIFLLDPCVASDDMFQLDMLYQIGNIMIEALRYGFTKQAIRLADLYRATFNDGWNGRLLSFYIARHALIQASVCYLYGDVAFRKYLDIHKRYDNTFYRS